MVWLSFSPYLREDSILSYSLDTTCHLLGGGERGDVVFIYFESLWDGQAARMTCLESYLTWSSLGSCSSILLRRIWRSSVGGRATCKMGSNIISNSFQWPGAGKKRKFPSVVGKFVSLSTICAGPEAKVFRCPVQDLRTLQRTLYTYNEFLPR